LPRFARPTFPQWFARHTQARSGDGRPAVVLLDDTFMQYNEPQIGIAAVRLLEAFGYRVIRAGLVCCGRPMISKGMLRQARRLAEQNVRRLLPLGEQGLPILGCEPSCVSALVDDYPALLATSEARRVAAQTFMLEHWLMQQARHPAQPSFTPLPQQVLLHGHCHQKPPGRRPRTLCSWPLALPAVIRSLTSLVARPGTPLSWSPLPSLIPPEGIIRAFPDTRGAPWGVA
jgi:Fe-S oxidoreductase